MEQRSVRWWAASAVVAVLTVGPAVAGVAGAAPAPTAPVRITTCGTTVTSDAVLAADLACPGVGIRVAAAGVTLRLDGHTLRSSGGPLRAAGVLVVGEVTAIDRVVVQGPGTIQGFRYGLRGRDASFRASHVSLAGNDWGVVAGRERSDVGPRVVLDTLDVTGANGLEADELSGAHIRLTRSTIRVTGAVFDMAGGDLSVSGSRLSGTWAGAGQADAHVQLTDNDVEGVSVGCGQALLTVDGNRLVGSGFSLFECEHSVFRHNRFEGAVRSHPEAAAIHLGLHFGTVRVAYNSFVRTTIGVSVERHSGEMALVGNTFRGGGRGIVTVPGSARCLPSPCARGDGGTVAGNTFVGNTGDGVVLREGTWRVDHNWAQSNGGHGILAQGPLVTVIDGGGNVAGGNAPPDCVGVACAPVGRAGALRAPAPAGAAVRP